MSRHKYDECHEPLGDGELPTPVETSAHTHEWVVFSTALSECWLMLQCVTCGAMATVDDPSAEEWQRAFAAPGMPYRWHDESRVTQHPEMTTERYVVRAKPRTPCDCICQECIEIEKGREYDRFPAEIIRHSKRLTDKQKKEIRDLALFVDKHSEMCSHLLPFFVDCFANDTGIRPSAPLAEIVQRVLRSDEKGLHLAAPVVADVLRAFASYKRKVPSERHNR